MEKLIIYQKTYDFILYFYGVVAKFPKHEKFTLQTQLKNCILEFLRLIVRANKSDTKKRLLYEADVSLEEFRTLVRLSHDLRYINPRQYGNISEKLSEIGRLLGGWIGFVQGDKKG